jgi:fructuronate reductase
MDGSQKLPQRLLSTVRERLALGLPIRQLALAVAAWIRYVGGRDEAGRPIDVRDPLADRLQRMLSGEAAEPSQPVAAVLGIEAIFGADLAQAAPFVSAVTDAYALLLANGARGAAALAMAG